jgi:hypothetical protein
MLRSGLAFRIIGRSLSRRRPGRAAQNLSARAPPCHAFPARHITRADQIEPSRRARQPPAWSDWSQKPADFRDRKTLRGGFRRSIDAACRSEDSVRSGSALKIQAPPLKRRRRSRHIGESRLQSQCRTISRRPTFTRKYGVSLHKCGNRALESGTIRRQGLTNMRNPERRFVLIGSEQPLQLPVGICAYGRRPAAGASLVARTGAGTGLPRFLD